MAKSFFLNSFFYPPRPPIFNRLRVGHSLLPSHPIKLGQIPTANPHFVHSIIMNVSVIFRTLYFCDLQPKRLVLTDSLESLNTLMNLQSILNANCTFAIEIIINFISDVGLNI